MPITIEWYDADETILVQTFTGKFTLEQYYATVDETTLLIREKDHLVHIIRDLTENTTMPHNVLAGARYAEKKMPPNQGLIVFINPGSLLSMFIQMVKKAGFNVAKNIRIADNIDAAVALIGESVSDV